MTSSNCLPAHGRIDCTICHRGPVEFGRTQRTEGDWRITANPLAWGNPRAEIIVLGFSKGPTQAGALSAALHNEIAYKGGRQQVGKILAHVGLIPKMDPADLKRRVDDLIADETGRFHFGSLIRCTVERYDRKHVAWKGSGGGMLQQFVATTFGSEIAGRCATRFIGNLPSETKLAIMFGLGTKCGYVAESRKLFQSARPGAWRSVNQVAYTDGRVTIVHVEHFKSQGALIPQWLGERQHPRALLGILARQAVSAALVARSSSTEA